MTGVGLGVSRERLDESLAGPVAAVVFDDVGTEESAALLDGLVDTDFARENLDRLLTDSHVPEALLREGRIESDGIKIRKVY